MAGYLSIPAFNFLAPKNEEMVGGGQGQVGLGFVAALANNQNHEG